jgi:alpha,alpha-trehalase
VGELVDVEGFGERPVLKSPEPLLDGAFASAAAGWPALTRPGNDLAFPLPGRFVAPGGFFDWFFYWDSCFTVLGLTVCGQWQLARELVDAMVTSVEEFGLVPNYNSPDGVCRSRSQSPFLTDAIIEVWPSVTDRVWLERAVAAATTEYEEYWTTEPHLTDLGLSRYVDPTGEGCGTVPDTPHHRAMAESGWDNTARFGNDASRVVPIDLNAQLFRYETDLGRLCRMLDDHDRAALWAGRARGRRDWVNQLCWDEETGWFHDVSLDTGRWLEATPKSLASFVPLWAGMATGKQAARMVDQLPMFEAAHGLTATEPGWDDGTEHTWPTGWAYSHWYVCDGLHRYDYRRHSQRIALKWLRRVAQTFADTGEFLERYNVVDPAGPTPGRYRPQPGFAWTNAVFAALVVRVIFGHQPDRPRTDTPPEAWANTANLDGSSYPWRNATSQTQP